MNNRKATKRALLTSVMALVMCVVMLVGTTFAWFTDTATANVNTIKAGNLKVQLQVKDNDGKWVDAKGKTLQFVKAAAGKDQKVLWEPGATYQLPELRVVNAGDLNLKYKIVINGIGGSAKLNEVIDWTMTVDGATEAINPATAVDHTLNANATKDAYNTIVISGTMQTTADNDYQNETIDDVSITVYATQAVGEYDSNSNTYDENAEYPTITTGAKLEEVFADANVDFGYGSTSTESVTLDGKGVAVVSDWTDAWVNSDTIIKGVTFKNGAVFSAKTDNVTVTLEGCTFYACDQSKLTYTGNNSLTNSGAGMCLNLEKSSHIGVKFIVKDCTFVGENDDTLSAEGPRYNGDGTVNGMKKRGHAIALDAICGGGTGTLDSLLIEGCTIDGVRGNAIQLYGTTGAITIKDTKINSWAVNNTGIGYAVRGDFNANGSRTLTLTNVYFGLDEISGNTEFGHVKVGSFSGNTTGTEAAGTYSK